MNRMQRSILSLALIFACFEVVTSFSLPRNQLAGNPSFSRSLARFMSEQESASTATEEESDPMADELASMSAEEREMRIKQIRADELRSQEVFMKKSTGIHQCTNCDWEYDPEKGDSMMIGGQIKPGTAFAELPSNWRCPVCRASKDSFQEVVEEIPGFEVNQGYGFGTNTWSAGQKNLAIFGGLGVFFVLFLSGYAMS